MRIVGKILLGLIILCMLLSVTVFSPEWVTKNILEKIIPPPKALTPPKLAPADKRVMSIIALINEDRTREVLSKFTSWGSRVVGYPGERKAFEYVKAQFEEIGLQDITIDTFKVTVPIDKGARLVISASGEEIPLYCLWPNEVKTPTLPKEGISGNLIYAKKGDFADFNGKEVNGSIVLMDFDSQRNFINARMLGAQAIIFFDNGVVTQGEAIDKFLRVPADVPRFWVERNDAEKLLHIAKSGQQQVALYAKMDWEEVEAKNIYGYLQGVDEYMPVEGGEKPTKWKDKLIVVEAYYDAVSVVPALAPGAENASGIAALLQIARALKTYQPKYSVLFLATSGHFQALAGVNEFLHDHARLSEYFLKRIPEHKKIDFDLFIGLDLSSHNDKVATFCLGTFYNPLWTTDDFVKNAFAPYAKKFTTYVNEVFPSASAEEDGSRYINAIAPPKRTWKDYMPVPLGLDSEAVIMVGKHGISLATPNDVRERVDTPADKLEFVNIKNVTLQAQTIAGILIRACEDHDFFPGLKLKLRDEAHDLKGHIYWYDPKVSFTPNVPIPGAIVTYQLPELKSCSGVRRLVATFSDVDGEFRFENIRQKAGKIEIRAYKIDEEGRIYYAPDMGWDGDMSYPITVANNWWELEMMEVLFKCRSLTLFEIIDSRYFTALDVLNVLTPDNSEPIKYGYSLGFASGAKQSQKEQNVTQAAVIFGEDKPDSRLKVLMGTSLFGIKYLLTNAPDRLFTHPVSEENVTKADLDSALGKGYPLTEDVVTYPAFRIAKDMWIVDDVRMKTLAKYAVKNERMQQLHQEAKQALQEAEKHLQNRQYDKFIAAARRAWGLEARGYPDVKGTANDTVRGIIFYFALLLPFSVFLERLLFGFREITKQIMGTFAIFVVVFLILQLVHPAFKLSTSPYVIFLGFIVMVLSVGVVVIVISKFNQELRKIKRTSSGIHEADVVRLSATMAAIRLGINNLRKRPLRTGLTAVTLILLTFTVLSFTSVRTSIQFYQLPRDNKPSYQGILIRDRNWKGLQSSVLEYAKSAFVDRAVIVPRSWYVAKTKGEKVYINFQAPTTGKMSYANALLGLTPQETIVTGLDEFLIGRSRWFKEGERKVCILPTDMAKLVGITPDQVGKTYIEMLGCKFLVIGIIDTKKFNKYRDLDDEKLTPVDTITEKAKLEKGLTENPNLEATAPIQAFVHLEASNTMLVPHEYVMDIGGTLRSVAITAFRDKEGNPEADFIPDVEEFMKRVALTVFVGEGDNVRVYSSLGSTSLSGLGNLLIPVLIAALIVLNTMLGAVYERYTEIGTYSSVGLAPVHIAALFIAEAAVFATIGAVMGYLVGQITAKILYSQGLLGGLSLNYSSLSAAWSTMIVMATVFLSTLYPARKAASMSVPDVTRKWVLPEPEGDEWSFEFPFTVGGNEALGMYVYLTKVFDSYGEGSIGDFTTEQVKFSLLDYQGQPQYRISLMTWLAPYDLGVSQNVIFDAIPTGEYNIYKIMVHIHRVSGDIASWKRLNRGFLHSLRKRFLIWRTVPPAVKDRYADEGRKMLAVAEDSA